MKEANNIVLTDTSYHTLVNDEGQFAIWPCNRLLPPGWQETGVSGEKAACLAYVREVWTDMRPPALRRSSTSPGTAGTCIHHLFEKQAAERSDATALIFQNERITYAELNRRANRLARRLQAMGAGPETVVGVFMERSPELITSILAILKAGAAYLPMDPTYPEARLEFMQDDAGVEIVLTQQRLAGRLAERTLCLDPEQPEGAEADDNLPESPHPDRPAYVIYTSGSTGTPKGVVVTHRNLVHATALRPVYYPEPLTAFLMLPSIAFDASAGALFWTLSEGGALVLPAPGEERDVFRLTELVAQHRVSHWLSVPALYSAMLAQNCVKDLASLRTVIVGGERCPVRLVARHFYLLPGARLYNDYGPTEGTILSSIYPCRKEDGKREAPVPIGKAVSGVEIHLLDGDMNPVPTGASGEIYIGGAGIARGYLNRPDLTAERFVPNPFGRPGERLYKTGDLARRLPDGNLVFIERLDDQVKVRGHRIELGEIESVLGHHPALREAVVVARQNESGENHLLAYAVATGKPPPPGNALKTYLRQRLPDYMVPSDFVFLERLPLTPNGKVDRAALPSPPRAACTYAFQALRENTEHELARIWQSVLQTGPVGLHSNFFELGGDSITAAHMLVQVEKTFNRRLSLSELMQAPTVEKLARELNAQNRRASWSSLVPIQPLGSRPPLFLIHGITGQVLHYYNLTAYLDRDQPVFGLQAPREPFDSVEAMAVHYLLTLRTVQPEGPYHLAGYCFGGLVAFEMAQRLRAMGQDVNFLGLLECPAPNWNLGKMQWNSRAIANLLFSLPHWLLEFLEHPKKHSARLQNLAGRALRRAARRLLPPGAQSPPEEREIDLSGYTEAFHEYVKTHTRAIQAYSPKPYPDEIVLFKSRTLTWFHLDPELGWGELADVNVHPIAGSHDDTLYEPQVRVLAEKLGACLDRITPP